MKRNPGMIVIILTGLILALAGAIPASAAPRPQVAASILLTPATGAPGLQITVQGANFLKGTTGSIQFFWDSPRSYPIGTVAAVSGGKFTATATIPPNATAGVHNLYAIDSNSSDQVYAAFTVVGTKKGAVYFFASDPATGETYQVLLANRGMLPLTLYNISAIANVDYATFDLIIIGADTSGHWSTPSLSSEIVRMSRSNKPILALGVGGYELLGKLKLPIGYPQGMTATGQTGIQAADLANPLFLTPYLFSGSQVGLYSSGGDAKAILLSNPVHQVVRLGNLVSNSNYSPLASLQGRYFLWGFTQSPSALSTSGISLLVNAIWQLLQYNRSVDTLMLVDYQRMLDIGYTASDVSNLQSGIDALVALPKAQSNMVAAIRYLDVNGPAALHTARASWIYVPVTGGTPGIESVSITNNYVNQIDQYIELLKQNTYPNLRYVIFVGAHEVIPMKARDTDDNEENSWAGGLPQTSGYLYSLYHDPGSLGLGHYLTDSIYGDLSYVSNGYGADDELIPELGVGRLVESPAQITTLVNNYVTASGYLASGGRASIASNDYMDGGQAAANILGSSTDTSLIQTSFDTNLIPGVMNAHNAFVYLAGHGNYNYIAPGFRAGSTATYGDTEELNMLPNSVVVTSGCHNGVNFGDMRYHAYTGNTTYGEFPERMANKGVGIYLGATGYTWITGTGASTNPASIGVNEKLSVLFIQHLLKDGSLSTPGKAYKAAVNDYLGASPDFAHYTRRVLAIAELYGIPNYHPPALVFSHIATAIRYGFTLDIAKLVLASAPQSTTAAQANQDITLQIKDWRLDGSGMVQIPGAEYSTGWDGPILPVISASQLFSPGTTISSLTWDEAASTSTTIANDVPLAVINLNGQAVPNSFSAKDFFPASPFHSSQTSTLGDGGVNLVLNLWPVQYNPVTHQTRIWTKLVFHVTYSLDTSSTGVDSDQDSLPDYWESSYGMDPNDETGDQGAAGDFDKDGLSNDQEYSYGADPSNVDSDHDGISDGQEVKSGTNPLDPGSVFNYIYLPRITR